MNEATYVSIRQHDGYNTKLACFMSSKKPRASILILHGMAEHQKRYYDFIEYLVEQGFDVYCYDHRGHGTDKRIKELGFFADHNGYLLVVEDAISVSTYIQQNNRSSKFFLLGHSMGSLIARNVIQTFDHYSGVILSGTTYPPIIMTKSGLFIASLIKKSKGPKHRSPFMNNLLFGNKNYLKLVDRTTFDWLTRSNPIVGAYIHDPFCGFLCTTSFYHDLINLTLNASKRKLIRLTKKEIPLYIISGEEDPVGGFGKEIHKYINVLKRLGFTNVTYKLYPNCRHELINELNKEQVYEDLYHWIAKRL